jgi:AcrR family transcriptional regulator
MSKTSSPTTSLREACVLAAREVIAKSGVEGLSMRDVARTLGISHQAPYRHFESRDHLLAEVMRRCFADFAAYLGAQTSGQEGDAKLEAMGHAYLDYAQHKPLEYRLMFGTPWPEPAQHPELVQHAVRAFNLLRDTLSALPGAQHQPPGHADHQAMFIWSALHGMASISQAHVMQHLQLAPGVEAGLRADLMARMALGLGSNSRGTGE